MKNPWTIIGIVAVVLFGGAFWYASIAGEKNNEGVEIIAHIKGNPDAEVTLVEYSDLQCPACASFLPSVQTVTDIHAEDLRFEYRHFPLPIHRFAQQAALAAEAAGQQGKFFEYHDMLFENQSTWAQSNTPQTFFLQYAEELELDIPTFRRHMNSSILREHIQAQFAEGRELGVTGTPTFFLNGERMEISTYQDFIMQIGGAVSGDVEEDGNAVENTENASGVKFGI